MSLTNIKITLAYTLALAVSAQSVGAPPSPLSDLKKCKIRANYLYNLSKFVQWPKQSPQSSAPTHICIFGDPPLLKQLKNLSPVLKISVSNADLMHNHQLQLCHIVFVSNQSVNTAPIIESMNTMPILTVGENTGFLDRGGIISLVVKHENDIQLDINLTQAKNNGFAISGNLLEIAESIK